MGSGIDTTLMLALAAWIIVNSHLEQFYPYRWLAADGLLGNTMFFFLSGFGVQSSLLRSRQEFTGFAIRRIVRLYPSVVLASAIFLLLGLRPSVEMALTNVLAYFVWPSPYTYVKLIVFFYVALWICDRAGVAALAASIVFAAFVFAAVYPTALNTLNSSGRLVLGALPIEQYVAFFWISTACGALAARLAVASRFERPGIIAFLLLLGLYFTLKLLLVVQGVAIWAYPMPMLIVLLLSWLAFSTLCAPDFVATFMRIPVLGPIIAVSGALTLQIYVVHEPLAVNETLSSVVFPLNLASIAAITLIGAILLKVVADFLTDLVAPRPPVPRPA